MRLDKTSQESGWNVSKTAVHAGIIMSISTNEYRRENSILIVLILSIKNMFLMYHAVYNRTANDYNYEYA